MPPHLSGQNVPVMQNTYYNRQLNFCVLLKIRQYIAINMLQRLHHKCIASQPFPSIEQLQYSHMLLECMSRLHV
jgi:hypothetical protein